MNGRRWAVAGLAAGALVAGGAWWGLDPGGPTAVHSVCGPDFSDDASIADESKAVAVVEAVRTGAYREPAGEPNAALTTQVKVLETVKGEFPAELAVTQSARRGGAPGRYAVPDGLIRYALLEPGRQYVAGFTGETSGAPGTEAWVWYVEPVERGVAGEVAHWRKALAAPPKAAAAEECDDTIN
ncbi:hypothetical protein [Streptomyces sp. NPDC096339]|uniref:hypothetical protein n=1 Tax=Streptomyces sp. NPDC096339 TaxID=3366086 RepID=UPI00380E8C57